MPARFVKLTPKIGNPKIINVEQIVWVSRYENGEAWVKLTGDDKAHVMKEKFEDLEAFLAPHVV